MEREHHGSSAQHILVDGVRGLLSAFEKILSGLGASTSVVESLKSHLPETSASRAAADESAGTQPKKDRKTETVLLEDGTEIQGEIRTEEPEEGKRKRSYVMKGRKKIPVTWRDGRWQQRKKAVRDFSGYEPSEKDQNVLFQLADFNDRGERPAFMELAGALGLSRGELLGRYGTIHGAGYVQKENGKYSLTAKGEEYVNSRRPAPEPEPVVSEVVRVGTKSRSPKGGTGRKPGRPRKQPR